MTGKCEGYGCLHVEGTAHVRPVAPQFAATRASASGSEPLQSVGRDADPRQQAIIWKIGQSASEEQAVVRQSSGAQPEPAPPGNMTEAQMQKRLSSSTVYPVAWSQVWNGAGASAVVPQPLSPHVHGIVSPVVSRSWLGLWRVAEPQAVRSSASATEDALW